MKINELLEGIKVYHGASEHGKRTIGYTGNNSLSLLGDYNSKRYGVFFSSNRKFSEIYGEVIPYEIHVSKSKILDLDKWNDTEFSEWLEENHFDIYREFRNIRHNWQLFEDAVGQAFYEFNKHKGFEAVTFIEYQTDDNDKEIKGRTYVLYDLHKVRKDPDPDQPDLFLK